MFARRAGNPFATRAFVFGALACLMVGIGVPAAAYVQYPDWMWGYYVDADDVPLPVVSMIFLFYWGPFLAGFGAPWMLERLRPRTGWVALGIGVVAQAILLAWQWPRYSTVTTLQEFRAGLRVPPSDITFLQVTFPLSLGIVVALLWLSRARVTK